MSKTDGELIQGVGGVPDVRFRVPLSPLLVIFRSKIADNQTRLTLSAEAGLEKAEPPTLGGRGTASVSRSRERECFEER